MPRRTLLLALIVALVSVSVMPPAAGWVAGAGELRVVEQRVIEIPDTRVISMSPDGRWLVAAMGRGDLPYMRGLLCVYAVATLDAGLRIEDVVWSPDGAWLAFAEETFKLFRGGDLWLMDSATGHLTNLDDDR